MVAGCDHSVPRIGWRGPDQPNASRATAAKPGGKFAPRIRQSPEETVVAWIRTRISRLAGTGVGTSLSVTLSGGPYFVQIAAFIGFASEPAGGWPCHLRGIRRSVKRGAAAELPPHSDIVPTNPAAATEV